MLSEKCAVAYFKLKNLIRGKKSNIVQTQNAESQFFKKFQLDPRDPVKAAWESYNGEWRRRKTMFQYSELFSDQYISEFSKSLLFTRHKRAQLTLYIHFHENSKDKVLKLSCVDQLCALGKVLDVFSKYPIFDLIVMTNTGTIIGKDDLDDMILGLMAKYKITGQTLHVYVQIPGTDKPHPPFQCLGKRYNNVQFSFLNHA